MIRYHTFQTYVCTYISFACRVYAFLHLIYYESD